MLLFVAQKPAEHLPLQHSPLLVQATLMFLQAPVVQVPVAPQKPEQHCELAVHFVAEPVAMHGPVRLPHWLGA